MNNLKLYFQFIFLSFWVFLNSNSVKAQTYINIKSVTVQGKVITDKQERIAYGSAIVLLRNDSTFVKGALVENGDFNLQNLTIGNYLLQISSLGYQTQTLPLDISGTSNLLLLNEVVLKVATHDLTEVTITAVKPLIEYSS